MRWRVASNCAKVQSTIAKAENVALVNEPDCSRTDMSNADEKMSNPHKIGESLGVSPVVGDSGRILVLFILHFGVFVMLHLPCFLFLPRPP